MEELFSGIYKGKTVLVTGHTGFKGSWLCFWLKAMGAKVVGFSLPAPTNPSHFELLKLDMVSVIGDIRDEKALGKVFMDHKPEIVFHMAAQPLVRLSYQEPVETFESNIMGTIKVFEACRRASSVKAIVNITSDKCYENKEWTWGYRENEPMGGHDPYSASKGCAELVAASYRRSFFEKEGKLMACVRSGNVIGGGDWAADRLIPDIMKAASQNEVVKIRNPHSTRPWQHVLEPLSGYLLVGQKLLEGKKEVAEAWNFGPVDNRAIPVLEVTKIISEQWNKVKFEIETFATQPHEAKLLKLDCSKAQDELKWRSVWSSKETLNSTTNWYRTFYENKKIETLKDLNQYVEKAKSLDLSWTK